MDVRERIAAMQGALAEEGCDAWLFYDFRGSDPIARRILGVGERIATRRWFYSLAVAGEPQAIVSAVEPHALDGLPGLVRVYRTWGELHALLRRALGGARRVAMHYSPLNAVPYVSRVDAGTVELVRGFGVEVVSAQDLIQRFEAVWSAEQYASHCRAASALREVVDAAFAEIARCVRSRRPCDELSVQGFVLDELRRRRLTAHHPPIVAAGAHSADPHYEPASASVAPLAADSFVLIDLWAKEPGGVYADITWTAYAGERVPPRPAEIFRIVREARDAGVEAVRRGLRVGRVRGCDVDAAVRAVIAEAGYGEYFVHRTGHSIGTEVHGNGANIDGFETPDDRRLLPGTCFSIEPGIYLPGEFGVRSELDVYIDGAEAVVTGQPVQTEVIALLSSYSA